jgi:hypothetical protein
VIAKHSTADERAVEKRTAAGQAVHHQAQLPFETERIAPIDRIVTDVRGQIGITTGELDRILPNESVQAGMVVARPAVPPTASLARKSTPPPMRVVPMRPSATQAERGGAAVGKAAVGETAPNGLAAVSARDDRTPRPNRSPSVVMATRSRRRLAEAYRQPSARSASTRLGWAQPTIYFISFVSPITSPPGSPTSASRIARLLPGPSVHFVVLRFPRSLRGGLSLSISVAVAMTCPSCMEPDNVMWIAPLSLRSFAVKRLPAISTTALPCVTYHLSIAETAENHPQSAVSGAERLGEANRSESRMSPDTSDRMARVSMPTIFAQLRSASRRRLKALSLCGSTRVN